MANRRKVNIDGISSIYGGQFDSVSVNGIGKIKEDIETTALFINGMGKVKGTVKSETIDNNGLCRFQKDIGAKIIKNNGVLKLKGNLEAEEFTSNGIIYVKGNITVDRLKAFFEKGSFSEGIFGDEITLNLINKSKSLNGPMWLFNLIIGLKLTYGKFVCNIIECTSLEADNLKAKIVRAKDVVLGPGCLIEIVEYSNSFSADESCVVKKLVKL